MTDKQPPESKQSKGGKARAAALTQSKRAEIARKGGAAKAKWPSATHEAPLRIGDITLDCAVLEDGTAVISETRLMQQMGIYRSGALSTRRPHTPKGERAPLHLAFKNLQPYIEEHFGEGESGPPVLKYTTRRGALAHGIRAEDLPKICEIWLDARKEGKLGGTQQKIAEVAEVLIRGFAQVGIVALVHEATGYQYDRDREALQDLLKDILSDNLRRWVRTFPGRYFRELCRLRGVQYRSDMRLPMYFGHLTNDIVYSRLAPQVLKELQERNPREEGGRRPNKHFQWLSENVGHPRLLQHLGLVTGLMAASKNYEEFTALLNRVVPVWKDDMPLFPRVSED